MKTTLDETNVSIKRLSLNSKLMKTILQAIASKKGDNIITINLRKIPEAVADYFVVCEASNPVQIKAIADEVEKKVKEVCGENPYKFEGKQGDKWIIVDYVQVVVHCMMPEARHSYNLEELWSDAEQKEHLI